MKAIPTNHHITYQLQYRKCGKSTCSTCKEGRGHGPYWYAYWREGSHLRSGYIGKNNPTMQKQAEAETALLAARLLTENYAAQRAMGRRSVRYR